MKNLFWNYCFCLSWIWNLTLTLNKALNSNVQLKHYTPKNMLKQRRSQPLIDKPKKKSRLWKKLKQLWKEFWEIPELEETRLSFDKSLHNSGLLPQAKFFEVQRQITRTKSVRST